MKNVKACITEDISWTEATSSQASFQCQSHSKAYSIIVFESSGIIIYKITLC